jgi:YjbE family integral membrane protein
MLVVKAELSALFQVVLIDITLAGDNAVVVGLAVQGLPARQRRLAILIGIAAATLLRVALSAVAISLLAVLGLTLAGGILLLWVCWKMLRELREAADADGHAGAAPRSLRRAVVSIVLADLSMSLDNVLAVAGAAREHVWVMVAGLGLSIVLMGVAADFLAQVLHRVRWIAWLGLAVVVYVAVGMVIAGWPEVAPYF